MKTSCVKDRYSFSFMEMGTARPSYWNKENYELLERIRKSQKSKLCLRKHFLRNVTQPSQEPVFCQGCSKLKIPVIDFETGPYPEGVGEIRGVCMSCYGSRIPCCGPLDGFLVSSLDEITSFVLNCELDPPKILEQNAALKKLVLTLACINAQESNDGRKMKEMLILMDLEVSDLFCMVLG